MQKIRIIEFFFENILHWEFGVGKKYYICLMNFGKYSRIPFIRINWDGETSGYAENPDN